jgi:asparagine synthase (glutamine-hydrolysing)
MAQFFGCIAFTNNVDISSISKKMQESMSFFTPDRQGIYETNDLLIVQKHLFNNPESLNAPELCQTDRFVLAASCRIDNREELFKKLDIKAKVFGEDSLSDAELILATYEQYGSKCVQHLIGDFAFVVWDKEKQIFFMAKDHLGIKPLFYLKNDNFLLFSTSITGIKAVFDEPLAINELYIAYNLKNFEPPVRLTFFEDIHRLAPAHFCEFSKKEGSLSETLYWTLKAQDIESLKTDAERLTELRRLFEQAIQCRSRTVKNIGCQLSGGLDSSAITVLASRLLDKNRLHTYSFVLNDKTRAYSENGIDEQNTQNEIIDFAQLNTENHHKIEDFHFEDVFDEMRHSNLIMGGYAHSDCIWQATLFKEAQKNGIGVVFSGFPGDECVSNTGRLYYYDYIYHKNWKKLWEFTKEFGLRAIKRILMYFVNSKTGTNLFGYIKLQKQRNLLDISSKWNNKKWTKKAMFTPFAFYPSFKKHLIELVCREHICFRTESEGAYALHCGVETVYPMADIRLLELAISLPVEMYKPNPLPRTLFRELCATILPDRVRLQTKYNGAATLAFFEYIKQKQLNESKDYILKALHDLTKNNRTSELSKLEQLIIKLKLTKIDYLIHLNKHF